MRINIFFKLIITITVSEMAGVIGAFFTAPSIAGWYAGIVKPALNPPVWVFGDVLKLCNLDIKLKYEAISQQAQNKPR